MNRYLDGIFVAGNKGSNSTAINRLPLSGTIYLIQDSFYFIQVEYSSIRSASFETSKRLTLQMFQDGVPRSIPSESMFISEHLTGSPKVVTVHPSSQLCAAVSSQILSTGTIMTAGSDSVLSLHAQDSFGNPLASHSISSHNVVAVLLGHVEQPNLFKYTVSTGNITARFALFKKGLFKIAWIVRGVAIYEIFSISVIPDHPDFFSISTIGEFTQFATAGVYFQHALAVFDSFGNMRSFLEKSQDYSKNIQLNCNISRDAVQYNSTLCRSDFEYAPSKPALSSLFNFYFRCGMYGVSASSIVAGEVALVDAVVTVSGVVSVKLGFNFSDVNVECWSPAKIVTVLPAELCATKSSVYSNALISCR